MDNETRAILAILREQLAREERRIEECARTIKLYREEIARLEKEGWDEK